MALIELIITEQELLDAIAHARQNSHVDNLRSRNIYVSFDNKIRGFLGEVGVLKHLTSNGISARKSGMIESNSTDIDLEYCNAFDQLLKIEVKTSLIPDYDGSLQNVIRERDIKIIKRESTIESLSYDFTIQTYFNWKRKERDTFLKTLSGNPLDKTDEELLDSMRLRELEHTFVSWIDKKSLVEYLNDLGYGNQIWWIRGFRMHFWKAPITGVGKDPSDIAEFMRTYRSD
jgi:hypothetical protein